MHPPPLAEGPGAASSSFALVLGPDYCSTQALSCRFQLGLLPPCARASNHLSCWCPHTLAPGTTWPCPPLPWTLSFRYLLWLLASPFSALPVAFRMGWEVRPCNSHTSRIPGYLQNPVWEAGSRIAVNKHARSFELDFANRRKSPFLREEGWSKCVVPPGGWHAAVPESSDVHPGPPAWRGSPCACRGSLLCSLL